MSGEFDNYRPPSTIVHPDGSVEIWDSTGREYAQHYPAEKPTAPREWATGGDNELFDPSRDTERPSNPIVNAFDLDPHEDDTSPKFGGFYDPEVGPHGGYANSGDFVCNNCGGRVMWGQKNCPTCGAPEDGSEKPVRGGYDHNFCKNCNGPMDQNGACAACGDHGGWDQVRTAGPSQGILNDDSASEENYRRRDEPGVMESVEDVSCPRCGKPTVDSECPHCGYNKGDDTWRYQDRTPDPGPFNQNVPMRDMHQYDDMVPWGSGATSHYVRQPTATEKSEMTDTYDAIGRMTIGRDDGAELNTCPECDHPMLKRASEGFEFCTHCGHRNKVMDAVVSKDKDDHWIEKAVKKPGQLHKDLGVPEGEKIPEDKLEEAEHSDSKKIRERAQFAENVKKGGFMSELENIPKDVGRAGEDIYNNNPAGAAGDIAGIGGDVVKGVGEGAYDHPLLAATLAAAPFALPLAGAGLAAAPLIGEAGLAGEGGLASGLAGDAIAGGLRGGLASYGNMASRLGIGGAEREGLGSAIGTIPGRATSMLKGAMGPGAAFTAGRMMGGGGGMSGGGYDPNAEAGYSTQNYQASVRSEVFTPEEVAERRAWSQNYDLFTHLAADDDQSSDLSTRDDGDNITDPKTQGSQQETGDSVDELLKSLGDDGSANMDSYTPAQEAAIHHFNDNLPTILAFGMHDQAGAGHPILEAVKKMLEDAFGQSIDGGDTHDEKAEVHHDEVPPEHEKSEAPHHEDEEDFSDKKAASVRKSVQLVQSPSPVPSPAQVTPGAGMQPQQQQSVAPCALCGGPHPTDQHPSAVTPPAQGGQFGTSMAKVAWLEAVAARKPKMCPFHGDLVDYSLTAGDPVSARTAVRPSDYGAAYCKSGEFEGKCNFKPGMVTQAYWDEREQKTQDRRDQIQETPEAGFPGSEVEMPVEAQPEAEEGYVPEPRHDVPADQETAVGFATMNNPDAALQMAAKLLREANVIPAGYHFDLAIQKTADIHSLGLTEGGRYKMHSNKYDVPDDVTVTQIKPTSIQVVYHFPGGMDSAPKELTEDQLRQDGIHTFEPIGAAAPQPTNEGTFSEELENRAQQPDTAPDPGEVTDLSQTHGAADPIEAEFDGELEGAEGDGMQMAAGFREVDGGFFVDQDDNPVSYEVYAAMRRETADPSMQWLWDDVNKTNQVSARQQEMQAVMAGRQFSYREQADMIQEPGKARNADKLDLSGTHYVEGGGYGHEEVPDDHILFGM